MPTVNTDEATQAVLALLNGEGEDSNLNDAGNKGREVGVIIPTRLLSNGEFIDLRDVKALAESVKGSFNPVYESNDTKTSFSHTGIEVGDDDFVVETFADLTVDEMTYFVSVAPNNILHLIKSYEDIQHKVEQLQEDNAALVRQLDELQYGIESEAEHKLLFGN